MPLSPVALATTPLPSAPPLVMLKSEPLDDFVPDSGRDPLISPASAGGIVAVNAETANAKADNDRKTDMTDPLIHDTASSMHRREIRGNPACGIRLPSLLAQRFALR